jgi:3-methyladenine DNA glycosylase Mpg
MFNVLQSNSKSSTKYNNHFPLFALKTKNSVLYVYVLYTVRSMFNVLQSNSKSVIIRAVFTVASSSNKIQLILQ